MQTTSRHRIVMLGGSGFVGHHLAARLASAGHRLLIVSRNPAAHRDLGVLTGTDVIGANVYDANELTSLMNGADVVINLVGILNESGHSGAGFQRAHVELVRLAANAARKAGVKRFLQMSAIGAAKDAPSHYLRSRADAEAYLLTHAGRDMAVTIFRPSVIFGPGDSFILRFMNLMKKLPMIMPLACPNAKFSPVYVGDVIEALVRSIDARWTHGRRIELCGPETFALQQLVRMARDAAGLRRLILPLPDTLSWLQAAVMEFVPGKPFSLDNYNSTKIDSVCSGNGLAELDIRPTRLAAALPAYSGSPRQHRLDACRKTPPTKR